MHFPWYVRQPQIQKLSFSELQNKNDIQITEGNKNAERNVTIDFEGIVEDIIVDSYKYKKTVLLTERIDILLRSVFRILKRFFEKIKIEI